MPRLARARMLGIVLLAALAAPRAAAPAAGAAVYGDEPSVRLSPAEAEAVALARARFSAEGARPRLSGALVAAARILAREAAEGGDPTQGRSVRNALARAAAFDPAPSVYVARGPASAWSDALARALGPGLGSATDVGVGALEEGGHVVAVVLASKRGARLDPFPQRVPVPARTVLSGQLRAGLCDARIFVTLPSGRVRELAAPRGVWFRVDVAFDQPGRHVVEVLAEGPHGPTVAALLPVAAGDAPQAAITEPPAESAGAAAPDPADAGAAVLEALQALRARHGLSPLAVDAKLSDLARRHSEAMRAAGIVGHAVPGSPEPQARVRAARIAYRRLFENVAASSTALDAHAAAVASPAHLRNMLEPGARRVGIGVAREIAPSGRARVYLTEIFVE